MNKLDIQSLAREMASPLLWRRLTAMRLLVERNDQSAGAALREVLDDDNANAAARITAMRTLDELGVLEPRDAVPQLSHADEAVRVHALQLSDRWLGNDESVFNAVLAAADKEQSPRVLLQFAMSLGESRDSRAFSMLVRFAREHLKIRWMNEALMSSLHGRAGEMFAASLGDPDDASLLRQLAEAIAARGDVTNVYLRKDVIAMHRRNLSLMPSFAATINPGDTASLLGWMRSRLGEDRDLKE